MITTDYANWQQVNRHMIAKILSELEYERTLHAELHGETGRITLPGAVYTFNGKRGIWGWLHIDPATLRCEGVPLAADHMLRQLALVLKMDDSQVAEHLEDLYATLRGDMQLLSARHGMSAEALIALNDDALQCLLAGHPKFIFNKGRRGWGLTALQHYAPEYQGQFRLHWVAAKRGSFIWCVDAEYPLDNLLNSAMDPAERQRFDRRWRECQLNDDWVPVPLHPWQWQQKIALHFLPQLAEGELIELGEFGDHYLAQQSLRTLTNVSRRVPFDIKLPLTIYNTSCYRGIPGKYISAGPAASRWLQQVFAQDRTLHESRAEILGEPAAGYMLHQTYATLAKAPYRCQEMLGVIWRENPSCYLREGEHAILMATLMETNNQGHPLIAAYIARSGLSAEAWLEQMFRVVVVPMYHLMCCYGVALIAHGQNITLVMKDHAPQRILLKDFQGDMRLVDKDFPQAASLPNVVKEVTVRLSADYLIHDLQTGHFVTVLRFISPLMQACNLSEYRFYQLLAQVLERYMAQHPDLADRFTLFNLFKPQIIRVVLNPVKLTYSEQDGGSRMLPDYLQDLDNPLYLVTKELAQ
ncbi:iucA / IucC family protein [Yersinia pseudotuberculosis]|uniref:IucA/IucC family protein n=1 Tax=Yersinia pseudotuberculosis TaxID=633 RepID=UPI00017398E8|nr:IucA/IucC family siderophore biosynthesis protein [Yersinia pseudotuberculosis]CQD58630.1 putative siderophore biosynthesis protein IucC [Yersinia intermedia]AJJ01011.1 iucA / IucC family protein [Yersinia pseudotuberculosis]AJJ68522.1 iucA / IucC family protein [Yersinia pseudotuberculosis PB1/+]AYX17049.1 IucA/IucC family siderophore biosynthesis protein [Yersinia pseudotuberculosis]MBO1608630.1 aerobactin synthase IucC [Yersinia pseudotuberculosis]